jgi:hypothetical protein
MLSKMECDMRIEEPAPIKINCPKCRVMSELTREWALENDKFICECGQSFTINKEKQSQQSSSNNASILPDDKYVVRYDTEEIVNMEITLSFEIMAGPHYGQKVMMTFDSSKAKKVIQSYRGGSLGLLAAEGDNKASKIEMAIHNDAINGLLLARVKNGRVQSIIDSSDFDKTYKQIYRQCSKDWIIVDDVAAWQESFAICKICYRQLGRLPSYNGEWPEEIQVRNWLNSAIDERDLHYHPEVKGWYDNLYSSLCKEYNSEPRSQHSSLTNWLRNHGFEVASQTAET